MAVGQVRSDSCEQAMQESALGQHRVAWCCVSAHEVPTRVLCMGVQVVCRSAQQASRISKVVTGPRLHSCFLSAAHDNTHTGDDRGRLPWKYSPTTPSVCPTHWGSFSQRPERAYCQIITCIELII